VSGTLHLTITTPGQVLVDAAEIRALRAEDASGSFGILPGHTDLVTVLPASVVDWEDAAGQRHYCAQRGGVVSVTGGDRVSIACRQGTLGDDLTALATEVRRLRNAEQDIDRRARVEQMRLHAQAVRQLMRFLRPGQQLGGDDLAAALDGATTDGGEQQ
jgi:F-type H+-transporting ATPase subunit epsilon